MKTILRLAAVCLFFLVSGFGFCQTNRTSTALMQVNCPACIGQKVTVKTLDLISMNEVKLVESRFDSTGQCRLKVPVSGPLFSFISIGEGTVPDQDSVYWLYLEPDQDLMLTLGQGTPTFQGKLGIANQYLYESNRITRSVNDQANELVDTFRNLPAEEQQKIRNDFGAQLKPLHRTISEDARISQEVKELLIQDGTLYVLEWGSNMVARNIKKLEEQATYEASSFFQTVPVNPKWLAMNMYNYAALLNSRVKFDLDLAIYYALKKEGKEKNTDTLAILMEKAILKNARTTPIREYLLAINIKRMLREFGATPTITQLFDRFKNLYPDSRYTATVDREFDKSQELGEGKDAKDFIATYPDGKEFRLSDLKGKVVYLDTWATWCGPCIGEFPASKKMIERFKENPEVVFLFVSVDTNLDKWKAYLKSGKAPRGIHVNQNTETQAPGTSLYALYRMSGIPHYIVIDQAGKIKINKAPRPSDEESYTLLDGLLKKQP